MEQGWPLIQKECPIRDTQREHDAKKQIHGKDGYVR